MDGGLSVDSVDVTSFPEFQDTHATEQHFHQKKEITKKAVALNDKHLFESETGLRALAADMSAKQLKGRERERVQIAAVIRAQGGVENNKDLMPLLQKQVVYVAAKTHQNVVKATISKFEMTSTKLASEASVFLLMLEVNHQLPLNGVCI